MFFVEKLHACIWSVLSVSDLWHGIISAQGWNTQCTIHNIPIICTGFLGHKLCITRYFSTLDAAKFTLPAALLVISGKPEFNYPNDRWLIHLTNKRQFLSQPLKHLQLGLLQLWAEQTLKVIHRALKKHSGFWWDLQPDSYSNASCQWEVLENVPARGGMLFLGQTVCFDTAVMESVPSTAYNSCQGNSDTQSLPFTLPWE